VPNDDAIGKRVSWCANEIQKILELNVTQDPARVHDEMLRARELRREIESYGFPVQTSISFDPRFPETPQVTVTVLKVNDNLSPEDQALYDAWFRRVNDIAT